MKFLLLLEELKNKYKPDCKETENHVLLLGGVPTPPPLAKHYIHPPMEKGVMEELLASYTRNFPCELTEIYSVANGMDLFWKECKLSSGSVFPFCRLSIYGRPVGALRVQLQPYDIRLEDSSRVPGTPESYLKFGLYREIEDFTCKAEYELFVDTDDNTVCSVDRSLKEFRAERHWDSIDDCLCSLFTQLDRT